MEKLLREELPSSCDLPYCTNSGAIPTWQGGAVLGGGHCCISQEHFSLQKPKQLGTALASGCGQSHRLLKQSLTDADTMQGACRTRTGPFQYPVLKGTRRQCHPFQQQSKGSFSSQTHGSQNISPVPAIQFLKNALQLSK